MHELKVTGIEKEIVRDNMHMDVAALALKLGHRHDIDVKKIVRQIRGYQVIKKKVPSWFDNKDLLFPENISLEQCSSEITAKYKLKLIEELLKKENDDLNSGALISGYSALKSAGKTKDALVDNGETPMPTASKFNCSMLDITGGFGVDFSFLSRLFSKAVYVERNDILCSIAGENFKSFGFSNIEIINDDGPGYLENSDAFFDLIFADPARRNAKGEKTVYLENCEPDITKYKSVLLQHSRYVLVKLSPMLDISRALTQLPETISVHVISVDNECKELLFLLKSDFCERVEAFSESDISIHCINLFSGDNLKHPTTGNCGILSTEFEKSVLKTNPPGFKYKKFVFSKKEESMADCLYASELLNYLYEPDSSVMKAGAFNIVSSRFQLMKLHQNSHLYTSDILVNDFPGRIFLVESCFQLKKEDIKTHFKGENKANITVRNFPESVETIRKKTGIKDGGNVYVFATKLFDGKNVLIKCSKI
jgi:16S rRNA G966 N2-methylase RsmD